MSIAWRRFKDFWAPLLGAWLVVMLLYGAATLGPQVALEPTLSFSMTKPASLPWVVVQWSLNAFFGVGLVRMMLVAARGGTPAFGMLFSGADRFLAMLATNLLVGLAVGMGFVLLIVPAFIVGYGLLFAPYFVVDANLGPFEALRASWEATRGQKFKLFILSVLCGLVCLGGLAACGLGLAVAFPVSSLAFAVAFTRVSGRLPTAGPAATGFGSPSP